MSVWLLELEALDASDSPTTIRFSSSEYIDDDKNYWDVRLKQPALYRAGMFTGDILPSSRSGYGEAVLINTAGELDYLVDYAFDGRNCSVYYGDTSNLIIRTTISRVQFELNTISLVLRDPLEVFSTNHPRSYYLGDNVLPDGLEGVEDDIKGLPKPMVFGRVLNAKPILVNTSKLIYEAGGIIDNVYDRGVSLSNEGDYTSLTELNTITPTAGYYRGYQGYFRLGDSPEGEITFDGSNTSNGLGDVVNSILQDVGKSITNVSSLNAIGEVGLHLTTSDNTTLQLLDELVKGCGCYWRVKVDSNVEVGLLTDPSSSIYTINDYEILSIERESSGSGSNGVPIGGVTIYADKIETVQTDLAGSITSLEIKNRLENEYRRVDSVSTATKTRHILAEDLEIYSPLRSLEDAQDVADRLLSILSVRRDSVTIRARFDQQLNLKVNDSVKVITDRLGYSGGRDMLILSITSDLQRNIYDLKLWG